LLDFLALRFVNSGWDVKDLMRTIALSQTYQQSSRASRERYQQDPLNRQLARGSRYRLDAEVVRDQVLSVSGLLHRELYGKSVKPPQPAGLWETVAMPSSYPNTYQPDTGERIYRRSLYTFWKRAIPPPQMSIFDAPSRESCIARRERTNTPLQALMLMNEEQMFAAARQLAQTLLAEPKSADAMRLQVLYETVTARPPAEHILQQLQSALDQFRQLYAKDSDSVKAMLASGADSPTQPDTSSSEPVKLPPEELAAWTMVAHSILNLDLTKTRE
jgi:hypothetical protein